MEGRRQISREVGTRNNMVISSLVFIFASYILEMELTKPAT
jgi:hypothetical protein